MTALPFRQLVTTLAQAAGLHIASLDSKRARIDFEFSDEGRHTTQTVWVKDYDDTWEFLCLSFLVEKNPEDFSPDLLIYALRANATMTRGFWCLEVYREGTYLVYMDNYPAGRLTAAEFAETCSNTARRVDDLEREVKKL